jgi:hypothetical protein
MTTINLVKNVYAASGNNSYSVNQLDPNVLSENLVYGPGLEYAVMDNGFVLEYEI